MMLPTANLKFLIYIYIHTHFTPEQSRNLADNIFQDLVLESVVDFVGNWWILFEFLTEEIEKNVLQES